MNEDQPITSQGEGDEEKQEQQTEDQPVEEQINNNNDDATTVEDEATAEAEAEEAIEGEEEEAAAVGDEAEEEEAEEAGEEAGEENDDEQYDDDDDEHTTNGNILTEGLIDHGPSEGSEEENENQEEEEEDFLLEDLPSPPRSASGKRDRPSGGEEPEGTKSKKQKEAEAAAESKQLCFHAVEDVLRQMVRARESDAVLMRNKQPALNRLRLLSTMRDVLMKKINFQAYFKLTESPAALYAEFSNWLRKLPDGSFPHPKIRNAIFTILDAQKSMFWVKGEKLSAKQRYPPSINEDMLEVLEDSRIATAVKYFAEHFLDETPENKKLANALVVYWVYTIRRNDAPSSSSSSSTSSGFSRQSRPSSALSRDHEERLLRQQKWVQFIGPRLAMPEKPSFEGLVVASPDTSIDHVTRKNTSTIVDKIRKKNVRK